MIRSYNQTWTISTKNLPEHNIILHIYNEDKYTEDIKEEKEVTYTGLTSWDIIEGGEEAEEIENQGLIDEHHEYLVLHFSDGDTATFRNSHTDMFIR